MEGEDLSKRRKRKRQGNDGVQKKKKEKIRKGNLKWEKVEYG